MADAGAIGVLPQKTVSVIVGTQVIGGIKAITKQSSYKYDKLINISTGKGTSFRTGMVGGAVTGWNLTVNGITKQLKFCAKQVPSYWSGVVYGINPRQSNKAVVGTSAFPTAKYTYRSISASIIPNYWTGTISRITRPIFYIATSVLNYWTGRAATKQAIYNIKYSKLTNTAAAPGIRIIPSYTNTTPLYWTGATFGINKLITEEAIVGTPAFPKAQYSNITYNYVKITNIAAAKAQYSNIAYNYVKDTNIAAALGLAPGYGIPGRYTGAHLTGPLPAILPSPTVIASTSQYSSITLYLRTTVSSSYQVKLDMGATESLLRIHANGNPLHDGIWLDGVWGTTDIKATILNDTITVYRNNSIIMTYTDSRVGAPELTTPGKIGFTAYKTMVDTFVVDVV